ncbi:atypical kinase COQ8B, mitochondrial-like [Octopus sinensis]|nr:atypical kinase COQ8B, mitochondrial-like [Octopus sinensis]
MSRRTNELIGLFKGIESISKALIEINSAELNTFWQNSSLKSASENVASCASQRVQNSDFSGSDARQRISDSFQILSQQTFGIFNALFNQNALKKDIEVEESGEDVLSDFPNIYDSEAGIDDIVIQSELFAPKSTEEKERIPSDVKEERNAKEVPAVEMEVPKNLSDEQPSPEYETVTAKQDPELLSPKYNLETKQELSSISKERRVPSSRIARLVSYSGLAAGLGIGALAEVTRRTLGKKTPDQVSKTILGPSPFMTEANIERVVTTLCRVRGAALKLGQMMSIQDNTLISPELQKIFERVRMSADFMPKWQMMKILNSELGSDWQNKVLSFDEKPFAAASIGQVHQVTLLDGKMAAMKIQYPGVAESIDSDINNLMGVLKIWNFIPKGAYLDNMIVVAKKELTWEVDYAREAECGQRFYELLKDDPVFVIPEVYKELSTSRVLTTGYIEGVAIDKCIEIDQETRNWIGKHLLRLTLNELFNFRFMQTDPNWANFFFIPETKRIGLLDFGASREFSKSFVDRYMKVIKSAADQNRDGILSGSLELGFLTGYETKVMEEAHIDAVMILGEAFSFDGEFNFGTQKTAKRIQNLVPVMIEHRLTPPPEESYSLHRKMSGAFLLCTKLKSKVNCKELFEDVWNNFQLENTNVNQ